jgi:hypothetical protein
MAFTRTNLIVGSSCLTSLSKGFAMRPALTLPAVALIGLLSTSAFAKLPAPTEEVKAKAAEIAAKNAWSDKVGLYQLCVSQDKTVANYRKNAKADGKPVTASVPMAACADPGPYVALSQITPSASKPLEASGAHSPPGAAISPPSTKATASEIAGGVKK